MPVLERCNAYAPTIASTVNRREVRRGEGAAAQHHLAHPANCSAGHMGAGMHILDADRLGAASTPQALSFCTRLNKSWHDLQRKTVHCSKAPSRTAKDTRTNYGSCGKHLCRYGTENPLELSHRALTLRQSVLEDTRINDPSTV
jgi:hypothetical protein